MSRLEVNFFSSSGLKTLACKMAGSHTAKVLIKYSRKARNVPSCHQRSKLTFSKSRLLATFNCKMVAIKHSVAKKKIEGEDTL